MTTTGGHGTMQRLAASKKAAFLKALEACGNIAKAAEQVGVAPRTVYYWRRRSTAFAERFDVAKEAADFAELTRYEQLLRDRIEAGAADKDSAILTMFRVKRLDPRYRDSTTVNVQANGPVAISLGLDPTPGPGLASTRGGMPALPSGSTSPSKGEGR